MQWKCFSKKTYGRIFVEFSEDIERVDAIIKRLDDWEYGYMPKDFITVYDPSNRPIIYGHKFELNMEKLRLACFVVGISVMLVTDCEENEDWHGGIMRE